MLSVKLWAAMDAFPMFTAHDTAVVAVSGGPDSVALLHALSVREGAKPHLHVAHLNHMLRGDESEADAQYVARLAAALGIPATIEARDVAAIRRELRLSLEEAGRLVRYTFLAGVVRRLKAVGTLVAHTADDQIETVVLHWVRGAGPSGLRGMRPVNDFRVVRADRTVDEVRVFRPMLEVTREEVENYCDLHNLQPRRDSSNVDPAFLRNRIRSRLLPQAYACNPKFGDAVLRAARIAADDDDCFQAIVSRLWQVVAAEGPHFVAFTLEEWDKLLPSLQYRLLREAVKRLQGNLLDISSLHLINAIELINQKPAGSSLNWPAGLRVVKRYRDFQISGSGVSGTALSAEGQALAIPGVTLVGTWRVVAEVNVDHHISDGDKAHVDLDFGRLGSNLVVRHRLPGDRFQPLGMANAKKLQDFFVDAKVPRDERDAVPVVVADGGIAWLVGFRPAEWAIVREETESVLCLRFERIDSGQVEGVPG